MKTYFGQITPSRTYLGKKSIHLMLSREDALALTQKILGCVYAGQEVIDLAAILYKQPKVKVFGGSPKCQRLKLAQLLP